MKPKFSTLKVISTNSKTMKTRQTWMYALAATLISFVTVVSATLDVSDFDMSTSQDSVTLTWELDNVDPSKICID